MTSSSDAPGWDAIDAVFDALYPDQKSPLHYTGSPVPFMLPDKPLQGISVYKATRERPHWHLVTYGFSELYDKEWEDQTRSGFGFELTMRLVRENDDPPIWAVGLLQKIAAYVLKSGRSFAAAHKMRVGGPIKHDAATDLTALLFVEDPQAPPIDTPNGRLEFLQIVGITADEAERGLTEEGHHALMRGLGTASPLFITDLGRKSVLD